jgi:hypothetical protein
MYPFGPLCLLLASVLQVTSFSHKDRVFDEFLALNPQYHDDALDFGGEMRFAEGIEARIDLRINQHGFHGFFQLEVALSKSFPQDCLLLLVQPFPKSIYVDTFQLQELERLEHKHQRTRVTVDLDLEKGAGHPSSRPFLLLSYQPLIYQ